MFSCITQFILVISPILIYELTKSIALGSLATALILSSDMPVNYPAGRLADNIGRKKTLLVGIALSFVGLILIATSRFFSESWLFWAGIVIFGCSTGFTVLNRAAIMDMYPKKRGQSLGYLNTGGFIGALMAPFIIAIIAGVCTGSSVNFYDFVLLLCIPFLAFSGLMLFGIRKDTMKIAQILKKNGDPTNNNFENQTEEPLFKNPNDKRDLILAFLISSLSVGAVSISISLSPTLMYILNAELWIITFAVALISFGTSGLSIFLGRSSDTIGRKKTIIIGIMLMSVGLCVLPLAQNVYLIALSNLLVGLGTGAMAIASTSMICDITNIKNRGKIFGLNSIAINIFTLFLPPLSATLFTLLGPFSVSSIGLIIGAVSLFIVTRLSKLN